MGGRDWVPVCLCVLACVRLPVRACLCVLLCFRAWMLVCLWLCAYAPVCLWLYVSNCGVFSARLGSTAAGDRRYSPPGEVHLARVICLHMLGYAALLVYTYAGCRRHVAHFVGVALR
jgi:hypothetical protein